MRNLIKSVLTICIFLSANKLCISQGLIINDETFKWVNNLPKPEPSRAVLPSKSSLERYTPSIIDQTGTSMCASFALSTIRTIIYARNHNITDIDEINKLRFSPTFLYYLFKDQEDIDCKVGMRTIDGVQFMIDYGLPFSIDVEGDYFHPFSDTMICNYYPYNYSDLMNDIVNGSRYTLTKEKLKICGTLLKKNFFFVNHQMLKAELFLGIPCLIGANFGEDFYTETNTGYSMLGGESSNMGHAMVIIGYDDEKHGGSYRVVNSYGENWKENGKTWIRYEDLKLIKGFIISIDGEDTRKPISQEVIDNYLKTMNKTFLFQEDFKNSEIIKEDELTVLFNECKNQHYYLQSIVNLDDFCTCYISKLVVKLMFFEVMDEELLQDLMQDCIAKNKKD